MEQELKLKQELMKDIVTKVLDINNIGEHRNFTGPSGPPAIFFSFFPHVGIMDLRIYWNGWDEDQDCERFSFSDYTEVDEYLHILDILREVKTK